MVSMYTDHHVHTDFSPDSPEPIENYLKAGRKRLMFTDHVDIGSPDPMFKDLIDYDRYFEKVRALEKEYGAKILVGVEMGYQQEFLQDIEAFVENYPFDFVIGSIHFGDGLDFYNGDYFAGKTQKESYTRYFEIVLDMVSQFKNFDVVGHLDYIPRYAPYPTKMYEHEAYSGLIDEILRTVIANGKGIEINTSGMRNDLQVFHPTDRVMCRYRQLGGTLVTLGSDAHVVKDLDSNFEQARTMLRSCGFESLASYEKRIPTKYGLRV